MKKILELAKSLDEAHRGHADEGPSVFSEAAALLRSGDDYTRAVISERDQWHADWKMCAAKNRELLEENAKLSSLWSQMKAERDELQNESLKWATAHSIVCDENATLKIRVDRLNADLTEARKDALRYQHCFADDDFAVCDFEAATPFCEEPSGWRWMDKYEADNRIDAAMKEKFHE